MKEFINKYKREVIVGVVVSLITAAIIKLWDWVLMIAPVFGKSIITAIDNMTYVLAATQSSTTLVRILLVGALGVMMGMTLASTEKSLTVLSDALKIEKIQKQIKAGKKPMLPNSIKEKIEKQENTESMDEVIKKAKSTGHKAVGMIVFMLVMYIFVNTTLISPSQLWSSFENDITMIAPYIENSEILKLKSDWVCMREKADYVEIYEYIDSVKEKHDLP